MTSVCAPGAQVDTGPVFLDDPDGDASVATRPGYAGTDGPTGDEGGA
ncbi:hypothetical protein [Streptomyces sp. H51]|nr:hypothetical protein [Streptomyces sp. H51]